MSGRSTWLLLALAVGLGGVTGNEIRTLSDAAEVPDAPVDAAPPAPAALPPVRLSALPALDTLSETVERPLFNPDRRPVTVEAAAPAAPAAPVKVEPPGVALSAVVIAEGRPIALMRDAASGKTVRVREGDTVGGWTVAKIQPDEVGLEQGSRTHALTLRTFEPAPAAPARRRPRRTAAANDGQNAEQTGQVRRPRRTQRSSRRSALERRRARAERKAKDAE